MVLRTGIIQVVKSQIFDMINIFENMPLYIRELAVFCGFGGNDKMKGYNFALGQNIAKSPLYDLSLIS